MCRQEVCRIILEFRIMKNKKTNEKAENKEELKSIKREDFINRFNVILESNRDSLVRCIYKEFGEAVLDLYNIEDKNFDDCLSSDFSNIYEVDELLDKLHGKLSFNVYNHFDCANYELYELIEDIKSMKIN